MFVKLQLKPKKMVNKKTTANLALTTKTIGNSAESIKPRAVIFGIIINLAALTSSGKLRKDLPRNKSMLCY